MRSLASELTEGKLTTRLSVLKRYIQECVDAEDWHGVRDCAVDIEVTLAKLNAAKNPIN